MGRMERTKDSEEAGCSKSPAQMPWNRECWEEPCWVGTGHGPDACSHSSLPPTQTGVKGLGTERTCVTIPRVKLGEVERPQTIPRASVAQTAW